MTPSVYHRMGANPGGFKQDVDTYLVATLPYAYGIVLRCSSDTAVGMARRVPL